MRRIVPLAAGLILGTGSLLARAGGISISFGAVITGQIVPGVYGQVVLGSAPPPLVYAHPMMIAPVGPGLPVPPPLYLYVAPYQAHDWRRYCYVYHACGRPVYFVSSPEYRPGFNLDRWRREHPSWQRERAWERPGPHGRGYARPYRRDYARGYRPREEHGHTQERGRMQDRGHDHGGPGGHDDHRDDRH